MQNEYMEMRVTGLTIDPFTNMPIVILKDYEERHALPVWVGLIEASAIATEIEKISMARPMTHDFIKDAFENLDVKVDKIEIYQLIDNSFYSRVYLSLEEKQVCIEARPSDAIAVALRTEAVILVNRVVIEKSKQIEVDQADYQEIEHQRWAEILENLSPEDFGKYKM